MSAEEVLSVPQFERALFDCVKIMPLPVVGVQNQPACYRTVTKLNYHIMQLLSENHILFVTTFMGLI